MKFLISWYSYANQSTMLNLVRSGRVKTPPGHLELYSSGTTKDKHMLFGDFFVDPQATKWRQQT